MFRKEDSRKFKKKPVTYSISGVGISKVEKALSSLKDEIEATHLPFVIPFWNGFASILNLPLENYEKPLFVMGTDGVGTKLELALKYKKLENIGDDLIAMNVDDILTCGAKPLAFLDYFAAGKIDVENYKIILKSIASACKKAECSLVGGETAEMPGVYRGKELDLAGFVLGIVEENHLLPKRERMQEGNALIGIASSGMHSNGYSLIRYIIKQKRISLNKEVDGHNLIKELLEPTKIYSVSVLSLLEKYRDYIHGLAHITGGGIPGNLPRILPDDLKAVIDVSSWDIPWIFKFFINKGKISGNEAFKVFNMGIGLIMVVSGKEKKILEDLANLGEKGYIIGHLKRGKRGVEIKWRERDLEF
ncbi:MAG TPA: phosphoribosylformylglycinamidine cyclo-ligase [Dictyoglomaceae bacterium]|nr:phosphoribosylformylglycinamidine cyclo-ligase [Dictyoglomaceae bacterium]HOL39648.1 phosphoribosylformylglycinamidine cyclo-ligase [Dictyoglomaceae bacterium]HPP15220.1 phosphoribosylformylglycinamidine cyclo-ligase [Dictyoglomaceae bacterium]